MFFNSKRIALRWFLHSHYVYLGLACCLKPAYLHVSVNLLCAQPLTWSWWLWLQFCYMSRGRVSESTEQHESTAWGNSWPCVGSVVLFKWIIFVSISFTRWLRVCHLWCESLLSFTFSLFINIKSWFLFISMLILSKFYHLVHLFILLLSLVSASGSLHQYHLLSLVMGSWGGEAAAGEMADGTRAPPAGTTKSHILSCHNQILNARICFADIICNKLLS